MERDRYINDILSSGRGLLFAVASVLESNFHHTSLALIFLLIAVSFAVEVFI